MFEATLSPAAPVVVPLNCPVVPGNDVTDLWDQDICFLRLVGADPRIETVTPPFYPFAIPRLGDETPSSQGQWGVALRYFAEAINTEFGAYYLRVHDKIPSVGYVAEPHLLTVQPTLEDGYGFNLDPFLVPVSRATAVPTGYFLEYPEGINVIDQHPKA